MSALRSWGAAWRSVAPSAGDYEGLAKTWRADLLAGLTVGVVALPIALGFGVASGVGASAGIFTAIVAGVVAAIFGGSSVQVSGPTGAMAVVLVPIVAKYGVGAVSAVAVLAGVLVVVMGLVGLGRVVQFVPWPVLEGFTVGIACTIGLQQVPLLSGLRHGTGSTVVAAAWNALTTATWRQALPSALLGVGVMGVMVVWHRINQRVPSSIVAVVVLSVVANALGLSVPTLATLPHHLPAPTLPNLSWVNLSRLFGPALAVAALAAIESLLSARVADAMTGSTTVSDRREMVGQGLGNVASGLFGGMPSTGAIARTAVNVRSGGRTRLAAVTHSMVIVIIILFAAPVVTRIPLSVLGGVLFMTAIRMVDRLQVAKIFRAHRSEALVFALTALVTIAVNLVSAIEVGLVVAGLLALRAVATGSGATQEDLALHHDAPIDEIALLASHIAVFRLDGALFFGAAPRFRDLVDQVGDARVVILRLRGLTMIDASGAEVLAGVIHSLEARGVTVLVKGVRDEHDRMLSRMGIIGELESRGHLFDDIERAIDHAQTHVGLGHGTGD